MDNALPSKPNPTESAPPTGVLAALGQRLGFMGGRTFLVLLDQGFVSGTSLLTTIVVGRYCGSDGLGLFTLAMSAVLLAKGFQETLVSTPYTVFRSRIAEKMPPAVHAGGALAGALLLAAILTSLALLTAVVFSSTSDSWAIQTLMWSLVVAMPMALAKEFARRFDLARLNLIGTLGVDVGVAAFQITLLIAVAIQGRLSSSIAFLIIGISSAVVLMVWSARRRKEFDFDSSRIKSLIKHDWTFGRWLLADQLICIAQLYAIHWLLTGMIDTTATGILAACASIAALASPFLQGIGNYLSPRFADTVSSGSRQQTMRLYWRTTALLAVAVTCFAGIASLFGSQLLWLMYDDASYDGYAVVVTILAVRLMLGIPAIAANHAVIAMEYPRGGAAATIAGLITTLCVAIPLISLYSVRGAAIALFLGTAVDSVVLVTIFIQRLRLWRWQDS